MRRLDHAGVYLLIAGTYTPVCLFVLTGAWRLGVLTVVSVGAGVGIAAKFVWADAPKWFAASLESLSLDSCRHPAAAGSSAPRRSPARQPKVASGLSCSAARPGVVWFSYLPDGRRISLLGPRRGLG